MEYTLVVVWLVALLALAGVATPLATLLLAPLPDRGSGLGLPLALAVVGVVSYWIGQIAFGWPGLVLALAVVVAGSALAVRRGTTVNRTAATDAAIVFAVGFLFVVALRAADAAADPYAGEKMLDFGLLATFYRADALPPTDMWYAGQRLQYYYGGHMIASQLGRLTGTAPAYAYNLSLAAYYGAMVTAAYGLARAVASARNIAPRRAGVLAAFLVGIASNATTPLRGLLLLVQHLQRPITFDGPIDLLLAPGRVLFLLVPNDLVTVTQASSGGKYVELLGYQFGGLAVSADAFGYWAASRVIPWTINEFPLFAYLNGDLHAHMMSPPFLLLAAAFAFAYWRTDAGDVWRRRAYLFVVAPALGGLLAVVNTWSFPAVAGLVALTTALAPAHPATVLPGAIAARVRAVVDESRGHLEATRLLTAGVLAAAVGVLSVAFALPFFSGATSGQHPALLPDRSSLVGLLLVHGAFLVVTVAYLADRGRVDRNTLATGGLVGILALLAVANLVVGWLGASLLVVAVAGLVGVLALDSPWRDRGLVALGVLATVGFAVYHGSTLAFVAAGGTVLFVLTAAAFTRDPLQGRASAWLVGLAVLATTGVAVVYDSELALLVAAGTTLFVLAAAALARDAPRQRTTAGLVVAFAVAAGVSWVVDAMVLVAVAPLIVVGAVLLRLDYDVGFELVLVLGATGLVTLVEFFYVAERAGPGRLNTVFKIYWQVWVLWATAGGVMLADIASLAWPRHLGLRERARSVTQTVASTTSASGESPGTSTDGGSDADPAGSSHTGAAGSSNTGAAGSRGDGGGLLSGVDWTRGVRVASTLAVVALVVSLSIYGVFAVAGHFESHPSPHWQCTDDEIEPGDGEWTLNAKDWSQECYPDQYAAIEWLNDRDGRPVVVEAVTTGQYLYGANNPASGLVSGVSSHTGLPTVAGWAHAANYHTQEGWSERVDDVETIYESRTASERAEALREYDVAFIYVGPNERSRYDVASLANDPGIERVQRWGDVVVYAVDRDALTASERDALTASERAVLAGSERAVLAGSERAVLAGSERAVLAGGERDAFAAITADAFAVNATARGI